MLYYNRIDVSEEIDANKTNESKECDLSLLLFFRYRFSISMTAMNIMIY